MGWKNCASIINHLSNKQNSICPRRLFEKCRRRKIGLCQKKTLFFCWGSSHNWTWAKLTQSFQLFQFPPLLLYYLRNYRVHDISTKTSGLFSPHWNACCPTPNPSWYNSIKYFNCFKHKLCRHDYKKISDYNQNARSVQNVWRKVSNGRGGVYEKMCYLNPNQQQKPPEWELGVKGLIGTWILEIGELLELI